MLNKYSHQQTCIVDMGTDGYAKAFKASALRQWQSLSWEVHWDGKAFLRTLHLSVCEWLMTAYKDQNNISLLRDVHSKPEAAGLQKPPTKTSQPILLCCT